jgi:hypothetical protein
MSRPRSTLAAVLLFCATTVAAPFARADDKPVNVVVSHRLESEVVDANGSGTLVVTGDIRPTAWVLADPAKFVVTTVAAEGVTYGKVETNDPVERRDPKLPDAPPAKVWTERIVVRVPFTLAANAKSPVDVGVELSWTACDETRCYDPERTAKPIVASVRQVEAPAAPAEPPPPAPPAPPPPPGETPKDPPAPPPESVPAPQPTQPTRTPTGRVWELKKEHNVDAGGGRLALRLTVPADIGGLKGSAVGVDVAFYDEQGLPIRTALSTHADAQGHLRLTSKTAQVTGDPIALDFVFLVPYSAFPSRGAKYTVEARASLSTRTAAKDASKLLGKKSTTFQVE